MKYTEKMSNKLNQLLEKNYDAEKGYKKAAEIVDNSKLKQFFESQAQNRYDFGHELKTEIRNYGETPEKGTSTTADMHRTWMDIKSTFTSNDEEAILNEVQRGEEKAVEEYDEIINDITLPPTTQNLLTKQRESIKSALQSAKNFEVVVS
ncbi:PA2169 family four-helix-bundle protein [Altibacter sp.]|uniref:ferritin-like domain-containing protein n=1 Tax=Altibacter sp. TaxID=2024823 RepID=UPI00258EDB44|nr:PA2169 family four-helix-bundle protein [Altibacter sp.]MCW8980388.1 PA2169 family four-helix-bundle protein [Altibacter sp.]MCW9036731.1 PA2169 family four-helix-bundle protein [Altibacter sp.]